MLHGTVMINDMEIMQYQITNEGQLFTETDDSDHVTYRFVVWGRDTRGYPYGFDFLKDVLLGHNSTFALVALAMTEAHERNNYDKD